MSHTCQALRVTLRVTTSVQLQHERRPVLDLRLVTHERHRPTVHERLVLLPVTLCIATIVELSERMSFTNTYINNYL